VTSVMCLSCIRVFSLSCLHFALSTRSPGPSAAAKWIKIVLYIGQRCKSRENNGSKLLKHVGSVRKLDEE
jgi:hypothetical protein